MGWERMGLIFEPDKSLAWQQSHAQNPFPVQLSEHVFRVFYASRDKDNTSRTGYFDLDMREPHAPKNYSKTPALDLGELGAFDDCGAMPHSITKIGDEYVLYYTGWSKAVVVPFTFFIGAAKSRSLDGPFVRVSRAPILGRNFFDPLLTAAPFVIPVEDFYTMFYISGTKWEKEENGSVKHYYTVKNAFSPDGINWAPNPRITIPFGEDEYAIARPVLFTDKGKYELWFSFRGGANTYRLGVAKSDDLVTWKREDLDFEVAGEGWDSQMICYAHPFYYNGEKYMLYNGNAYGAAGVGLAVLR